MAINLKAFPFLSLSMVASHWGLLVALWAYLDLRRPTTSELAITETGLLRVEVARLRELIEQLEGGCARCEWDLWWAQWSYRFLTVFGILAILICWSFPLLKRSGQRIQESLSLGEERESHIVTISDSETSPTARPETALSSAARVIGPVRPSDRRRLKDGFDTGRSGGSSVGSLSA